MVIASRQQTWKEAASRMNTGPSLLREQQSRRVEVARSTQAAEQRTCRCKQSKHYVFLADRTKLLTTTKVSKHVKTQGKTSGIESSEAE